MLIKRFGFLLQTLHRMSIVGTMSAATMRPGRGEGAGMVRMEVGWELCRLHQGWIQLPWSHATGGICRPHSLRQPPIFSLRKKSFRPALMSDARR